MLPLTNATHYDLKPHVIQLLPSFDGLDHENPYFHVKKFKNICATTKFQNFFEESVQLRLFPFSLHDRAMEWLDSNAPGSITSWESLLRKFYNKFFPMSRVSEARKEISSLFKMRMRNSLRGGGVLRICLSDDFLMVTKNGDSCNSSTKGCLSPTVA